MFNYPNAVNLVIFPGYSNAVYDCPEMSTLVYSWKNMNSMNKPIIVRIMRLLTFFLFCGCMQLAAATHSQTITVRGTNLPMQEVFKLINLQTGYSVVGFDPVIDGTPPVSVKAENMPLRDFLDVLLPAHSLSYSIHGKTIVIKKNAEIKTTVSLAGTQQQLQITGSIADEQGEALPGVNVGVKGQTKKAVTDRLGRFTISDVSKGDILVFSMIGFQREERTIVNQADLKVVMKIAHDDLNEIVVVGYGTQKKSDITGAVASLSKDRLEMVPNTHLAQAIQGAIPGVSVMTTTAGAEPSQSIMLRGRRSITASNSPLVVIDGIVGALGDLNPGDVASVEILKDASAAAIYGSRGANGVILVTTKLNDGEKSKLNYNGYYATQRFTNLPAMLSGEEFYNYKMEREPTSLTPSEQAVYESGQWTDWFDLAFRNGKSTQHNLSLSGGSKDTKYYISGSLVDIKGLAINDKYRKYTLRTSVETKIRSWLTLGTKTQLSYVDAGGIAPTFSGDQGVFTFNPLTTPYDADGELTIYPWPDNPYFRNPLQGLLAENVDEAYQAITNNYAVVDFPFVKGLQYRINTGVRIGTSNDGTYYGRNTQRGLISLGDASVSRALSRNMVVENILNYNKGFDKHHIAVTGVYSFENTKSGSNNLSAQGFPNDFLNWYSAAQAQLIVPGFSSVVETSLLSAMARINYSYDSRYLITFTGRQDGFSGFGAKKKWGFFPSMAVGWNISKERFYNWNNIINDLKIRVSYGENGNQAIDPYQTISRLSARDYVSASTTLPGYVPTSLGQDNLGWESTRTLNAGLDFGILNNRITGDINLYRQNTYDLLLNRTISPVHAVTSITQNIGETENNGLEISLTSQNIDNEHFKWETSGNIAFVKNKIVSLYGYRDSTGKEIDDIANTWFIGKPILVNYGFLWDGVWQSDEADLAAAYGTQPGFIKVRDISGPDGVPDTTINAAYDRTIIGQRDPKFIWGMTNSFFYKNFTFRIFIHGVHGITKNNPLLAEDLSLVRYNVVKRNWWTPDNPTNEWWVNVPDANKQNGQTANQYENAGFVRIKDISIAYDLPKTKLTRIGIDKLQVYLTGRNLFTITRYGGLDPELSGQEAIPLQKEYVMGINLNF